MIILSYIFILQAKDHLNARFAGNVSDKRLIYRSMKQLIAPLHPTNAQFATKLLDIHQTSIHTWPHIVISGKNKI